MRFFLGGKKVFAMSVAVFFLFATCAQAFPFDANQNYSVGERSAITVDFVYPTSVFLADFDGDGNEDAVTANYYAGTVSIILNNGTGEFPVNAQYPVNGNPLGVTAADIDDDGDKDIATGNYASNTISILFNHGDGSFSSSTQYAATNYPRGLAFADIDGDGDLDLGVAKELGSSVTLFLNDGEGVFTEDASYLAGVTPSSLVFADFDSDDDMDMGVANYGAETVSVFLNDGDGTYATGTSYASGGEQPSNIVVADVDGDDDTDLIAVNARYGSLAVFKNNGNGTFAAVTLSLTPVESVLGLAVGDLDGDGDPDLTTAAGVDNSMYTFFNDGTGTFSPGIEYMSQRSTNSVQIDDLDDDGDQDVVTTGGLSDNISVYLNRGDGNFPDPTKVQIGNITTTINSGDFDNDGDADLVAGHNEVSILLNTGDGDFAPVVQYSTGGEEIASIRVLDLDADGDLDLGFTYIYIPSDSKFGVMLNNGDGTFAAKTDYATGFTPTVEVAVWSIAFADFNSDGSPDAAITEQETGKIFIFWNDGEGVFTMGDFYTVPNLVASVVARDFDGDGDVDLAVTDMVWWTSAEVTIFINDGSGAFTSGFVSEEFLDGEFVWDMETGDFNRDGSPDLAISSLATDRLYIFINNGNATFGAPARYQTGRWGQDISVADADVDGDLDITVTDYAFNSVAVFINNGNGTFQPFVNYLMGRRPFHAVMTDLDGNGTVDLAASSADADWVTIAWSLMSVAASNTPQPVVVDLGGGGLGAPGVNALPPFISIFQISVPSFQGDGSGDPVQTYNPLARALVKLPDDGNLDIQQDTVVYYIDNDGVRHAFPTSQVYFSWYKNFEGIQLINSFQLEGLPLGKNVTYKPWTHLVKFTSDPRVYAIAPQNILRRVVSEVVAHELYGKSWNTFIEEISDTLYVDYIFGADIEKASDIPSVDNTSSTSFPY